MNYRAAIAVCLVFLGCCTNIVFLELLVKEDPGSGNLMTFLQFLFIASEGFIFTSKFGTVKPGVHIKEYLIIVCMFFIANISNNYAFDFNIPMPLHMIFRAGSLVTNMVMTVVVLKRSYALSKYISVIMITVGVAVCTIVSSTQVKAIRKAEDAAIPTTPAEDFFWWTIGISLLIVSSLVSALLGIYQENLHVRYGKRARESLFYTHLLPLPFFLLLSPNIYEHAVFAVNSAPMELPVVGISLPIVVFYLLVNVFTQYVCISSVFLLTTESTTLTVTLVLTLRKFMSLIFSILYFKNPFTIYHWLGTLLVFIGTVIFTEVVPKILSSVQSAKKKVA